MEQPSLPQLLRYLLQIAYLLPVISPAHVQPSNDVRCDMVGGECMNTYEGRCEGGDFRRGLCAGASYRHCCVLRNPRRNPEDEVAPSRMCFSCAYSVYFGKPSGNPLCQDEFNANHMLQVNCSGQCAKQWLRLDESSFAIERRCLTDCHPTTTFEKDYAAYCCWGELCNNSVIPRLQLKVALPLALLILVVLL